MPHSASSQPATVNWARHFDRAYCFHFVNDADRLPGINAEFRRVGLLDSGIFRWANTFPDPWEEKLLDAYPKIGVVNNRKASIAYLNLGLASCRAMREALSDGCKRVLFLEDDIRFLKDLAAIETAFSAIPEGFEIVQFEKQCFMNVTPEMYANECIVKSIDDLYYEAQRTAWYGGGCFMATDRGMRNMLEAMESFRPAPMDNYMRDKGNRCACVKRNLAIQLTFQGSVCQQHFSPIYQHKVEYDPQGVRYEDYAILNDAVCDKGKTCFVVCVQGGAEQWDRTAYVVDSLNRHVGDSSVAVVYMGEIPEDSLGASLLRQMLPQKRLIRLEDTLDARARNIFSYHYQKAFAPIVIAKMFIVKQPEMFEYRRIVCVDNDMEIRDDLTPLTRLPIAHGIAGTLDDGFKTWESRMSFHRVPYEYFGEGNPWGKTVTDPIYNAGLIVFDRETLPSDYDERIEWSLAADRKVVFPWPEQDMLNLVMDFSPIPARYNVFWHWLANHPDPAIAHYVGVEGKQQFDGLVLKWLESTTRKLKIVVYAIAKNEAQFAERWYKSMSEADEVVVLDTGSTDGTPETLRRLGAKVETRQYAQWTTVEEYNRIIEEGKDRPWRFDWARNDSIDLALRLVPDADILVCTDPDEILLPGWRAKLEAAWIAYTRDHGTPPTTATYWYVWDFNPDGSDGTSFLYEKVHSAKCAARWAHPVHEILDYGQTEKRMVNVPGMRLEHRSAPSKSSRGLYLRMLELSVTEAPDDDRNAHYLCREYLFYDRWDDVIRMGLRHLSMPTATWTAERAASMRYIAKAYGMKGDAARQELWLRMAVKEEPNVREAALELMELMYGQKNWQGLVEAGAMCLEVKSDDRHSYLTQNRCWGALPYDLLSLGLFWVGRKEDALSCVKKAISLSPDDQRLRKNAEMIEDALARK